MNYLSFVLLSQNDKLKEIWKNGTLIAERQDNLFQYELYQLNDYYAEKQCNRLHRVSEITKTFKSLCYLDPYLSAIDINGLYDYK